MSKLVLGYWAAKGAAQHLRYLLEYVGLPYEDIKYNDKEIWQQQKAELIKVNPLANLPYIKDGDQWYFENSSLAIFIAHKSEQTQLLGTNVDEKVAIKQLQSVLNDAKHELHGLLINQFDSAQMTEKAKPLLAKLEFLVEGKTWSAGEKITISDFYLYMFVDLIKTQLNEEIFNGHSNLLRIHKQFQEIPQIKEYIKTESFKSLH